MRKKSDQSSKPDIKGTWGGAIGGGWFTDFEGPVGVDLSELLQHPEDLAALRQTVRSWYDANMERCRCQQRACLTGNGHGSVELVVLEVCRIRSYVRLYGARLLQIFPHCWDALHWQGCSDQLTGASRTVTWAGNTTWAPHRGDDTATYVALLNGKNLNTSDPYSIYIYTDH